MYLNKSSLVSLVLLLSNLFPNQSFTIFPPCRLHGKHMTTSLLSLWCELGFMLVKDSLIACQKSLLKQNQQAKTACSHVLHRQGWGWDGHTRYPSTTGSLFSTSLWILALFSLHVNRFSPRHAKFGWLGQWTHIITVAWLKGKECFSLPIWFERSHRRAVIGQTMIMSSPLLERVQGYYWFTLAHRLMPII